MDDYNTSVLSEAKNEYSANLVNILTPLLIQGVQSIFKEAYDLCSNNDEYDKYLMTFQNFLTRVPKWNQEIIENETKRIVQQSRCNYLEDLLTCVHITQLKVLTSIRVATAQKKIDIDVPKLSDFIHKVYIKCARKFYSNVYLFEMGAEPLNKQKNIRECEIICKECILNTIRESMPIEKILRAYIDETTEEEIIEEETIEPVKTDVSNNDMQNNISEEVKEEIKNVADAIKEKVSINKLNDSNEAGETTTSEFESSHKNDSTNSVIETIMDDLESKIEKASATATTASAPAQAAQAEAAPAQAAPAQAAAASTTIKIDTENESKPNVQFNDTDSVINYVKTDQPMVMPPATLLDAPKTIERLEKISNIRAAQRKLEEEEEEEEEDVDKLTIFNDSPTLNLDALDVHVLDENMH